MGEYILNNMVCTICKLDFEKKIHNQKYCSTECFIKGRRIRMKLIRDSNPILTKEKKLNYIKNNSFAEPTKEQLSDPAILNVLYRNGYGACTSCGTWHPKEGRCAPLSEKDKKAKLLLEELFPKEKPL